MPPPLASIAVAGAAIFVYDWSLTILDEVRCSYQSIPRLSSTAVRQLLIASGLIFVDRRYLAVQIQRGESAVPRSEFPEIWQRPFFLPFCIGGGWWRQHHQSYN